MLTAVSVRRQRQQQDQGQDPLHQRLGSGLLDTCHCLADHRLGMVQVILSVRSAVGRTLSLMSTSSCWLQSQLHHRS